FLTLSTTLTVSCCSMAEVVYWYVLGDDQQQLGPYTSYELQHPTGKLFTIELNYVHDAFACITYNGEKLVDYVHDAFLVGTYNQSYSVSIHPLNDSAQWLPGGGPVF
ncbi:hypothetical protein LINPERHAP1_LOCUS10646, partial [Linum perenne]